MTTVAAFLFSDLPFLLRPLADRGGQCAKLLVVVGLSHKTVLLSDGGISKYLALCLLW